MHTLRKKTVFRAVLVGLLAGLGAPLVAVEVEAQTTPVLGAPRTSLTTAEQEAFLESAEIVAAEEIGTGVTRPWRLTLSDDVTTHDAAFQSVDRRRLAARIGNRRELNFVDSYRYNIAAYRLATLLGLGRMVPVTVERSWKGRQGALSWWVDDVMFDEKGRQDARRWPEDMRVWTNQTTRMQVFAELVHDTDRNKGNILYTSDWSLYMLDFSRAFRLWDTLQEPQNLIACDRALLARLVTVTEDEVREATHEYLTDDEINAVMKRRALLVEHFHALIERRGEVAVLFDALR